MRLETILHSVYTPQVSALQAPFYAGLRAVDLRSSNASGRT